MLFGLGDLGFWKLSAELDSFAPALECSFAVNLLYSILLNFGSFSGRRIAIWAYQDRLRIRAALVENQNFDSAVFETKVNGLKGRWGRSITVSNIVAVIWGILAAIASAMLLTIGVAFYGKTAIPASVAMLGIAALFGAIPAGLISCGVLHSLALVNMWMISRDWNNALKYFQKAPSETVAAARDALKQKRPRKSNRDAHQE